MTELETIDDEISKQSEKLSNLNLNFNIICEFNLGNANEAIPWDDIDYQGVYLIEIKNNERFTSFKLWVDDFKRKWNNERALINTPKLIKKRIKKRIKAHSELQEWIPIYIGKSKEIKKRICEHINKKPDETTYALKLLARKEFKNDSFRLNTLNIKVENYDVIVPKVECQLRKKINPIIGRK